VPMTKSPRAVGWLVALAVVFSAFRGAGPAYSQEGLAGAPVVAGVGTALAAQGAVPEEAPPSVREHGEQLVKAAGKGLSRVTYQVHESVGWFAASPYLGWAAALLMALLSVVLLFGGCSLLQHYFTPLVTLIGMGALGFLASSILQSLDIEVNPPFRAIAVAAGCVAGGVFCMLCALRARPFASFLVVLLPLLVASVFAFSFSLVAGTALLVVGLILSVIALRRLRPLAIFSTSLFGAGGLICAWGVFAELTRPSSVYSSFNWLAEHPWMMLIAFLCVLFVGLNFQALAAPQEVGESEEV